MSNNILSTDLANLVGNAGNIAAYGNLKCDLMSLFLIIFNNS